MTTTNLVSLLACSVQLWLIHLVLMSAAPKKDVVAAEPTSVMHAAPLLNPNWVEEKEDVDFGDDFELNTEVLEHKKVWQCSITDPESNTRLKLRRKRKACSRSSGAPRRPTRAPSSRAVSRA